MKPTIQSLIGAVFAAFFSFQVTAETGLASSPNGKWSVVDRKCSDGGQAKDAFQLGRDSMQLTIQSPDIILDEVIDGKSYVDLAKIDVQKQQIVHSNSEDSDASLFMVEGTVLMTLSYGFEKGGTCSPGQMLLTVFEKQ